MIELLAVMAVLMFLSLFTMPVVEHLSNKARLTASLQDMRVIEQALEAYQVAKGHYPDRLGKLVDEGYIKTTFTFKSPWSTSQKTKYYFYAIDRDDQPLAFILGDPATHSPDTCTQKIEDAILRRSSKHPLPCGRNPSDQAYLFSQLSYPDGSEGVPTSLSSYRESCDPKRETNIAVAAACVVKTES